MNQCLKTNEEDTVAWKRTSGQLTSVFVLAVSTFVHLCICAWLSGVLPFGRIYPRNSRRGADGGHYRNYLTPRHNLGRNAQRGAAVTVYYSCV
jgi:hypothetical protein